MTIDLSVIALAVVVGFVLAALMATFRYIPNDRVGIVEKLWSSSGSLKSGLIALNGEAGFQPRSCAAAGTCCVRSSTASTRCRSSRSRRARSATSSRVTGSRCRRRRRSRATSPPTTSRTCAAFLATGGQRGPQRKILREGTYAHQPRAVRRRHRASSVYFLALEAREDGRRFKRMAQIDRRARRLRAGRDQGRRRRHRHRHRPRRPVARRRARSSRRRSATMPRTPRRTTTTSRTRRRSSRPAACRGRQLQVLVEGTYYINRLFATVEMIPKTVVEVGNVGVVVSYTGETGRDLRATEYKHGELVETGKRGVWSEPLLPGKYAFNTYAGKVIDGADDELHPEVERRRRPGSHKFDENLAEVSLITKDAFEPSLPLSVVVHIDYRKAPLVDPALRRHQAARRADARPDGRRRTSRTSARRAR